MVLSLKLKALIPAAPFFCPVDGTRNRRCSSSWNSENTSAACSHNFACHQEEMLWSWPWKRRSRRAQWRKRTEAPRQGTKETCSCWKKILVMTPCLLKFTVTFTSQKYTRIAQPLPHPREQTATSNPKIDRCFYSCHRDTMPNLHLLSMETQREQRLYKLRRMSSRRPGCFEFPR